MRTRIPAPTGQVPAPESPADRAFSARSLLRQGATPAHDFSRLPVDSPPEAPGIPETPPPAAPPRPGGSAPPIQAFSLKGAARSAAGHVGGAARDYFARKVEPFRNAAKGLKNLKAGATKNPLGALRVGLGILGLPGWTGALGTHGKDEGADAREVFRDQWEEHFSSLPPEAQAAARKRYPLHARPVTKSAESDAAGKGCCSKGEGQVPGEGAKPPDSSFEQDAAQKPAASGEASKKDDQAHEG